MPVEYGDHKEFFLETFDFQKVYSKDIYRLYKKWCEKKNVRPHLQMFFVRYLKSKFKMRTGNGDCYFYYLPKQKRIEGNESLTLHLSDDLLHKFEKFLEQNKEMTIDDKETTDVIDKFIEEYCYQNGEIEASELYKAYQGYCKREGLTVMSNVSFGMRIAGKKFEKTKHPITRRVIYHGLSLRKETEEC